MSIRSLEQVLAELIKKVQAVPVSGARITGQYSASPIEIFGIQDRVTLASTSNKVGEAFVGESIVG